MYRLKSNRTQCAPLATFTPATGFGRWRCYGLWERVGCRKCFGEATVETDIFLQTLGLADASRSSYDKLLPETRASLQAYSEGVNSFLDQENGLFGMKYSPEFLVLGHTPSHWQPWESVLVLKVMGLTLGSNMDLEIKRFKLAMTGFKPDEIDDLVPYGPRDNPPDLPELLSVYDVEPISASLKRVRENKRSPELAEALVKVPIGQSASNNWVVSGKRTESGMPLLANDPPSWGLPPLPHFIWLICPGNITAPTNMP